MGHAVQVPDHEDAARVSGEIDTFDGRHGVLWYVCAVIGFESGLWTLVDAEDQAGCFAAPLLVTGSHSRAG